MQALNELSRENAAREENKEKKSYTDFNTLKWP